MNIDHTATLAALREGGLPVDSIEFDGQIHRVPVEGKPNDNDGGYIAYHDKPMCIWWYNWRSGEKGTWTAKEKNTWTAAEREAFARHKEETPAARGKRKGWRSLFLCMSV